jgi:hypothetical protein
VDICKRLGLDALGGVDDEDRAFAGLERVADLVGEIDVTGRIDQVEAVVRPSRALPRRTARALMVIPSRSRSIDRGPGHHPAALDRNLSSSQFASGLPGPMRDDREAAAVLGDGQGGSVAGQASAGRRGPHRSERDPSD